MFKVQVVSEAWGVGSGSGGEYSVWVCFIFLCAVSLRDAENDA